MKPEQQEKATPGRKRDNAAHAAILKATHELLWDVGFDKLSIVEVASRAGVGKATIYRWWPDKSALAMEAFMTRVAPTIAFPHTDSALDDIRVQAHRLGRAYRGDAGRIVRTIIASGISDEKTMKLFFDGYLAPRRNAAKEVFKRAAAQGEILQGLDLELVIDALYAPFFHRMTIMHAPIDKRFVDFLLDSVLSFIASEMPKRRDSD
ncbi:TetR/AcrR family transcriptional regulator [Paraburkholderia sediminicola]|uniref:TetR/AcrR family transcriptional regulator n=1 Tax=Paraburkholderia sediminicola TaxID=458836 RepID=UPI0038B7DE15